MQFKPTVNRLTPKYVRYCYLWHIICGLQRSKLPIQVPMYLYTTMAVIHRNVHKVMWCQCCRCKCSIYSVQVFPRQTTLLGRELGDTGSSGNTKGGEIGRHTPPPPPTNTAWPGWAVHAGRLYYSSTLMWAMTYQCHLCSCRNIVKLDGYKDVLSTT